MSQFYTTRKNVLFDFLDYVKTRDNEICNERIRSSKKLLTIDSKKLIQIIS